MPLSKKKHQSLFEEARHMFEICAICKYCNGYCEVFRRAEERKIFSDGDLTYLAHLCHNCRNCWPACQYAPPHEFALNVPKTLADIREFSWKRRNWIAWLFIILFPCLTLILVPWDILFASHRGEGAFYKVLPWSVLVSTAAIPFLGSLTIMSIKLVSFWMKSGGGNPFPVLFHAVWDAVTLTNLKGGGIGCRDFEDRFSFWKRRFHLILLTGFMLCICSTLTASFYHHYFHLQAPYPVFSLPVMLGTIGGVGILIGCAGLFWIKRKANPDLDAYPRDYSFLFLLFFVSLSGLILLIFRETRTMGILLAWHMGCVTGFFATLTCGKFAHAPFRALALLRAAMERRELKRIKLKKI